MKDATFATRESTGPLDSGFGAELRKIEKRIGQSEEKGIEARWEFGRALLRQRQGKQLPKGLAAAITEEFGISRREISYRMQFAETFPAREEVGTAVPTYDSWDRIKREALPKKPRQQKPVTWEEQIAKRILRIVKEAKSREARRVLAEILTKIGQDLMNEENDK